MADLAHHQLLGDDADHPAARVQRGLRGDPHQADAAAAIDQRDAARGKRSSERRRRVGIGRARAVFDPQKRQMLVVRRRSCRGVAAHALSQ